MVREPAAPFWPHQEVVTRVTALLYDHVERHALGAVCASPIDVVLDRERGLVLQPDVVFLSTERLHLVRDQIWGAPDLVVEVESPGTRQRDRVWKHRWYQQYGVREYWLIDVDQRAITVSTFGRPGRLKRRTVRGTATVRSAVLPALAAPASAFFPRH
jgi:Uma2 family endonuclease